MNKRSENEQDRFDTGVVFGDAAHVQQPSLPLLIPDEELNDSFVQMRRSRLQRALQLLEEMEQITFDWQNAAIALLSFSLGLLFSASLASIGISSSKGFFVYLVGACGTTAGLVLAWTYRNFRKRNTGDIARQIRESLPRLENLRDTDDTLR